MQKITIRRLKPKDRERLYQFFMSLSRRTKRFFHPHKFDRKSAEKICRDKKDYYYGLFYGKEIIGYSMLRGFSEGYEVPSYGGCIADGCQGFGLGQFLLRWTIKQAKNMGCKRVILKVDISNDKAIHIYRKFGFKLFAMADKRTWKMDKEI